MFDALSDKLQKTFRNLRGLGKISETVKMDVIFADMGFNLQLDG